MPKLSYVDLMYGLVVSCIVSITNRFFQYFLRIFIVWCSMYVFGSKLFGNFRVYCTIINKMFPILVKPVHIRCKYDM